MLRQRPGRTFSSRSGTAVASSLIFFFNDTATTEIYTTYDTLSLHDALPISTCHHLLSTLVNRGYVAKVPVRRTYALGARILFLSNACLTVDLPARAAPLLAQINEKTGETVHLALLQGDAMMKVAKRESRHPVRVDTGTLGKTDAAHATATGKAMLAWLPEDDMRRVLSHGMA